MRTPATGLPALTQENVEQITRLGAERAHTADAHGHRAFLLIECHHTNDSTLLHQWFDDQAQPSQSWLPQQNNTDRTDQIQQLLGSEHTLVVYDATQGVDPRLLAASAGTLVAGGLMLLLTPPLDSWANRYDNEYDTSTSVFLRRIATQFKEHCTQTSLPGVWQVAAESTTANSSASINLNEQDDLLKQLLQDINTAKPHVVVIQADRGRGKSTLLARALLSEQTNTLTTVTALHQSATHVMQRVCKEQQHDINYVPLQQALQQTHELLLVDEAATIPINQLLTLAAQSKQIIFATTVDGYEGAGRGFATRFAKLLDKHYSGWKLYQPTNPIRWQSGDPLEALFNRALLLKSELPALPPKPIALDKLQLQVLQPEQLINDEALLESTFAILARAHYQTTAMDLRHMLDSPGMSVWVASINGVVCAAALVCSEGEIDNAMYADIANKKRRLKHQLLPQLLTQFTLQEGLLNKRYQRIVRIAVTPDLQGLGIGSALVSAIVDAARKDNLDIGSSFGADKATLAFWVKQGFTPIHLGYKRNPRSGLASACLLKALTPDTIKAQQYAHSLLCANLQLLQQSGGSSDYAQLIDTIMSHASEAPVSSQTTNSFKQQARLFADGNRNFLDSLAAIQELIGQSDANTDASSLFHSLMIDLTATSAAKGTNQRRKIQELATLIGKLLG